MKPLLYVMAMASPHIALAQPPEGLWLTHDQTAIIATGACETGSPELCAMIVGLKDQSLTQWAEQLCGLPIFWSLQPAANGRWVNGQLLNPATQEISALSVSINDRAMVLTVADGNSVTWQRTQERPEGCEGS